MRPLPEKRAVLVSGYVGVRIIEVRIIEEAHCSDLKLSSNSKTGCKSYIRYDEKTNGYSILFKARIVEQESYINVMRIQT